MVLRETNLDGILPLLAKGKVRDIYEVDSKTLLFVATDRISAYDVIMKNTIPDKGVLLTKLSEFWFSYLSDDVRNHLVEIPENKRYLIFCQRSSLNPNISLNWKAGVCSFKSSNLFLWK